MSTIIIQTPINKCVEIIVDGYNERRCNESTENNLLYCGVHGCGQKIYNEDYWENSEMITSD